MENNRNKLMELIMSNEDIVDTNDFLDQYSISQCVANELSLCLQRNQKLGI